MIVCRIVLPKHIFFNRTENSSTVSSLLDPILGGSRTNINHSIVVRLVYNYGKTSCQTNVRFAYWLWTSLSVWEIRGSISLRSNRIQGWQRFVIAATLLRSCAAQALGRQIGSAIRYTLRRNTTSIMKT